MYHIKITQNGETKLDVDTKALFATIDEGDSVSGIAAFDGASSNDIVALLRAQDEYKEETLRDHPSVRILYRLGKLVTEEDKKDKTESDLLDELISALKD